MTRSLGWALTPSESVSIQLSNGKMRELAMDRVEYAGPASEMPTEASTAERHARYRFRPAPTASVSRGRVIPHRRLSVFGPGITRSSGHIARGASETRPS